MEKLDRYDDLHEQVVKLTAEARELVEPILKDLFQGFFAKYPEVKSFYWTQYIPYFNDGDPCRFTTDIEYPTLLDENEEELSGDKWREARSEVVSILQEIYEEDFESVFGSYAQVSISRSGITIEDYELPY